MISDLMKLSGVLLLLLLGWFQVKADEFFIPESKIISVSLNSRKVEVNRTFDVADLGPGYHTIVLTQLPQNVEEKSITVEGKGPADLLSTTQVRRNFQRFDTPDFITLRLQLRALRDSINEQSMAITREMTRLSDRIATLKRYIDVSMKPSGEAASSILPLDKMTELLDIQDKEISAVNKKISDLEMKKKSLNDAVAIIDEAANKLEQTGIFKPFINRITAAVIAENQEKLIALPEEPKNWANMKSEKDLQIKVFIDEAAVPSGKAKLSFFVSYMASPAQWSADYDLTIDKKPSTATSSEAYDLKIAFYAAVEQTTGEDWEDVALHLSTADPVSILRSPSPQRHAIQFWKKEQRMERFKVAGRSNKGAQMKLMRSVAFSADAGADDEGTVDAVALESFPSAAPPPPMEDMESEGAALSRAGDLGATYVFSPKHKVTVRSNSDPRISYGGQGSTRTTSNTRLFISEVHIQPLIYSYVVPTDGDSMVYLKSWSHYSSKDTETVLAPLLSSHDARVFLQGSYVGTTIVPTTQPGATLRLDLGEDKKTSFKSTFVLPREHSKEEDKSTWFVTDKEKFHVKYTEYAFTVQNTHESDHLIIMSEYMPHAVEEAIKVEMISPNPSKVVHLSREGSDSDVWSEEEFIDAVLQHPVVLQHPAHPMYLAKKASFESSASSDIKALLGEQHRNQQFVFLSKGSNNMIWAQWVKPGQSVTASLKYKIIWPDGKEITIS